jgi:hypothetical protein
MTTVKAVRAIITLGDIEIDVFQMPTGEYRLSKGQTCDVIGLDKKRLSELQEKNSLKAIAGKGSHLSESIVKMKYEGATKPVELVPIQFSVLIWIESGSEIGKALAFASVIESIERRADAAFGIIRNEQERNARYVTRRDSILSRHFSTDCIDSYCKTNPVSDAYRRWVYLNVSDYLNKALFGMKSKEIRQHYDIGENSPRDYFPAETLKIVDTIEKATALRVKLTGICPKQAIKDVVGLLGIEPDQKLL